MFENVTTVSFLYSFRLFYDKFGQSYHEWKLKYSTLKAKIGQEIGIGGLRSGV